jgi:cytochrome c oxidase subunit 4
MSEHHAVDHPEHHIVTPGIYLRVLAALTVLMILTILAAKIDFGHHWINLAVALTIALAKMTCIMLFFMHVKYSSRLTWVFAGAGFFWFLIMISFTLADFLTRDWHSTFVQSPWPI